MQKNNDQVIIDKWRSVTISDRFMFRHAKLSRSIVLFICKFDPFDLNYPKYSFENLCQENTVLCLKDESFKIFINTTSNKVGLSPEVVSFMEYINTGVPTDTFTDKLEDKVKLLGNDDEKAVMYMTYEQEQMEAEARGEARGEAKGELKVKVKITENMIRKGVKADIIQELTELSLDKIREVAAKIGVALVE